MVSRKGRTVEMPNEESPQGAAPQESPAPPPPPSGLPQYAVTIEQFASQNAWRVDDRGDVIPALEMMGGFIYLMRQEGRNADFPANYARDWEAFRKS